jgi:hypothetical protein
MTDEMPPETTTQFAAEIDRRVAAAEGSLA